MDRGTLIRSHVVADLGNILHSRHQYHWHTGYVPPQTVAAPHLGSWIARVRGPKNPAIPAFINIGQRLEGVGESEELKAFTTAGFFGSEYGPFNLPYPDRRHRRRAPAQGDDPRAVRAPREDATSELVKQSPLGDLASDYHQESMLRAMDNAHRLLNSPERDAFDLTQGAEGELRQVQHRPVRPGLPAGPAADRGRGALHRGDDRVRPVPELGHARERPRHATTEMKKADRPPDRPADPRPGSSAGCSTARSWSWPASSAAT